jgi:putative 4-mercaptohistidine N1-methyltranferase
MGWVEDLHPVSIYEQDDLLAQYLLLHYGQPDDILPYDVGPREALDYPVRCVSELLDASLLPPDARALDVGCAVGRSSFELSAQCATVIGIDFSRRFIGTARTLAAGGATDFYRIDEGALRTPLRFDVPLHLPREHVSFEVGDACALREDLGGFDVVLNANLVDRLPDPRAFLRRLPGLVNPGGQLLLSSPFTWMDEYTPRADWLGGFERDGRPVHTWDTLQQELEPHFELAHACDLPFLIREHARKFQWSVARAGRWVRRR